MRADPVNHAARKIDNVLTSLQLFFICSLTAILEEKAECTVPSKPFRLAPLATHRPGGGRAAASGQRGSVIARSEAT
jgi:hypothetical protein